MGVNSCGERSQKKMNKRPCQHHLPKSFGGKQIGDRRQQQCCEMANYQERADTPIDAEPCVE